MRYLPDKLLSSKRRIWELDFLRGLSLALMVFDHLTYDLSILPAFYSGENFPPFSSVGPDSTGAEYFWYLGNAIYTSPARWALHYIFASVFLLLTGISCTLSRSNLMRFFKLGGFAVLLSCATTVADGIVTGLGSQVIFGVLHCMAFSVLLYMLIDGAVMLFRRLLNYLTGRKFRFSSDYALLIAGGALVIAGLAIPWYRLEWTYDFTATLPGVLKVALGVVRAGSDHFGIVPCSGIVLLGSYIGRKFYSGGRSLLPRLDGAWNRCYAFIGRHTAWVYVLHQPIIAALIVIIGIIAGVEVL